MLPEVKAEDIVYSTNPRTGLLEARNLITGELIAVEKASNSFDNIDLSKLVKVTLPTGETILTSREIKDDLTKITGSVSRVWNYNKRIADIVIERMLSGDTLTKICATDGFPSYAVLSRWRLENEDFAKAIEQARSFRAEQFHDKIVDASDDLGTESLSKDEVVQKKAQIDTLKWLAEKNDSKRYGGKDKTESAGAINVKIVVNTGIDRQTNIDDIEAEIIKPTIDISSNAD